MDEQAPVERLDGNCFSRGELLRRTAGVGLGLTALGGLGVLGAEPALGKGLDKVTFLSPLATLETMSFYDIVVANQLGYFKNLGLEVPMLPGTGGTNATLGISQHQADLGWPAPPIITYSIDQGVPVKSIWQSCTQQVFGFALPLKSKITKVSQLGHKTIGLHNEVDYVVTNPLLYAQGVDPKTVKYLTFGELWPQATALGQCDAALCWEGERGLLIGQHIPLKYLRGSDFSNTPSNSYAVRTSDLKDPHKRDVYKRFLMGVVMGNEFALANMRAAAQITYDSRPALQSLLSPQGAMEAMAEQASSYQKVKGLWGWADIVAWQQYLDIIYKLKQTKHHFKTSDILTNEFVVGVNKAANVTKPRRDAKAFKLDKYFAVTTIPNYKY
jgi:NitT/TauT family transport system substrate-binding protein